MYPQLMTVAQKAAAEQDRPMEGVQLRSAQLEAKDDTTSLKEQIRLFWVVIQRPPRQTASGNPKPLGNG